MERERAKENIAAAIQEERQKSKVSVHTYTSCTIPSLSCTCTLCVYARAVTCCGSSCTTMYTMYIPFVCIDFCLCVCVYV